MVLSHFEQHRICLLAYLDVDDEMLFSKISFRIGTAITLNAYLLIITVAMSFSVGECLLASQAKS